MNTVNIAKDFSRFPAGRFMKDGPFNGERFRKKFVEPPLRAGERITILMDGTRGYGSSFLEEAFGGLIRAGFTLESLRSRMELISSDPGVTTEAWGYIEKESREQSRPAPRPR